MPYKDLEKRRECKRLYARTSQARIKHKKWKENNIEKHREYKRRYMRQYRRLAKDKIKRLARSEVNKAVQAGRMIRPDNCTSCGGKGKIEGHHPDYNKPLEVQWLCAACHGKLRLIR